MLSTIYWIGMSGNSRLAIMARPRAGDWLEDEIANWHRSGVEIVVSLLERDEVEELGLIREPALCQRHDIEFRSWPIPDRGLPHDRAGFLQFVGELAESGKNVAVHCRAGIGRSSVLAAAIMIHDGQTAELALTSIATARGVPVPDTDEQRDWIIALQARGA
jgi:protein-tyrosine phosphatase